MLIIYFIHYIYSTNIEVHFVGYLFIMKTKYICRDSVSFAHIGSAPYVYTLLKSVNEILPALSIILDWFEWSSIRDISS